MVRAFFAICLAIVASCSGDGVSLIAVSARNTVPWRATTIEYPIATLLASVLITWLTSV